MLSSKPTTSDNSSFVVLLHWSPSATSTYIVHPLYLPEGPQSPSSFVNPRITRPMEFLAATEFPELQRGRPRSRTLSSSSSDTITPHTYARDLTPKPNKSRVKSHVDCDGVHKSHSVCEVKQPQRPQRQDPPKVLSAASFGVSTIELDILSNQPTVDLRDSRRSFHTWCGWLDLRLLSFGRIRRLRSYCERIRYGPVVCPSSVASIATSPQNILKELPTNFLDKAWTEPIFNGKNSVSLTLGFKVPIPLPPAKPEDLIIWQIEARMTVVVESGRKHKRKEHKVELQQRTKFYLKF